MNFVASVAQGVGKSPCIAARAKVGRSAAPGEGLLLILPLPLSIAVGVGRRSRGMNSVFPFILQRFSPCVCTVGNNPDAFSFVWRSDTASWNIKRLDGISCCFKLLADFFECEPAFLSVYVILFEEIACASHFSLLAGLHHGSDSSNVFTNDPSGLNLPNRS